MLSNEQKETGMAYRHESLACYQNHPDNIDIEPQVWFVTFDDGSCLKVLAESEQAACIKAEDEWGGTAVRATLKYPGRRQ